MNLNVSISIFRINMKNYDEGEELVILDQNLNHFLSVPVFHITAYNDLSRIMRKPAFCICKNKDADSCVVTGS